MRCSKCGAENREAAKFCDSCGAQLSAKCPSCGAPTRAGARFCDSCGEALRAVAPAVLADSSHLRRAASGERRHLTVLFCDLVGSTQIAAQLDPEEWREVIASYHRSAAQAIERYGGHVAQYLGDGVMAYFGYPEAHDNDAERAVRAGLAMLEVISKLKDDTGCPRLSVRVGIDSGAVVVCASDRNAADVFGEVPNIAARVQTTAEPDSMLITSAAHRLVSGLFVVEAREPQILKGIAKPIELYRVSQRDARTLGRRGGSRINTLRRTRG